MKNTCHPDEPLILEKDKIDAESWKAVTALLSIPENASRIVITYSKLEFFTEDAM